jgi:hypothetical protein
VLFEKERTVIGKHLKNVFESGELDENLVCANFAHTTPHGAIESDFDRFVKGLKD